MLMLLGFAAIGVDASAAYAEKRQAQSEADAAVLAGALTYLDPSSATPQAVAAQVMSFAAINAPGTPPTATDWAACKDPDKPADYSWLRDSTSGDVISECISLKQVSSAPALLRVRTPSWDMPTSFAGLLGFDTVAISATATAELRYSSSLPVLPFSLPSTPSTEECLATPPSGLLPGDAAPCGGPSQGNFGLIDSPWFGAGAPEYTNENPCPTDPNFNTRAPHNLAYGLDHLITSWPTKPTTSHDTPPPVPAIGTWLGNKHPAADSCANAQTGVVPYVLNTQTGNTQTAGGKALLQDGFLGDDPSPTAGSLPGRLRQDSPPTRPSTTSDPGWPRPADFRLDIKTNTQTFDVDNIGLWDYLADGMTGPCASSQFTGSNVGRIATNNIESCLKIGSPTFQLDLIDSPRFAVVPVLNYAKGSQFGNKWWAVLELRPVYLQTTWYDCTNGQNTECLFQPADFSPVPSDRDSYSILFNPGEGTASPCYIKNGACVKPNASRFQLMGLSALVLNWDQIPGAENQFGGNAPFDVFLHPNE